ncbi:MAG TPA: type ISP restriction/modification enzyme [Xanthobacteraceae bacterium]|nr:type ISP restriction/modification enzyme [Xanthobacteraceae bacterium]
MQPLASALAEYVAETRHLDPLPTSTEATFYPAIKALISVVLKEGGLPFEVRVNTSETKGKARDMPDFVLGDDKLFVGVFGEVKRASELLEDIAVSTERNDQIGRYLAQTGVVLISNVRGFGLLACAPDYVRDVSKPIPPAQRSLIKTVDLWSAVASSGPHARIDDAAAADLVEIIERSVTDYAPIADPADLAKVLARQARDAKDGLPEDLRAVRPLLNDYRQALGLAFDIDDERGDRFFRSSLVQTAFYSLFAAWVLWDKTADTKARFEIDDAHAYLPIPFLDALLHDIRHPKRLQALGLEDHLARAVATLNRVDRALFRARMTFPTIDEQTTIAAITYFYEPFLEAFDPRLREDLGVWYTPPEIVRYQVRRVHHILKTDLKRPHGLADPDVVVLDPCCGTGAYLLEVARCIAEEAKAAGEKAAIGLELTRAFHERVIGFEILTAPFAVAQLQLYLLLDSLGAKPDPSQRLCIFLTNALSGWHDSGDIKLTFPEMKEEFDASQQIKQRARIIVIMGNPPYDRFAGAAQSEEAELVARYKGIELVNDVDPKTKQVKRDEFGKPKKKQRGQSLLYAEYGVRKQLLDDLYIRFLRLAEERIGEAAEYGVVSFISNSSYLTGRSHPLMRKSLLSNFHKVWIDNLNGDKYRTGKLIPAGLPGAGSADQSAFTTEMDPRGIQPGTAIVTWIKRKERKTGPNSTDVHYRDFWGLAAVKRSQLVASLPTGKGTSTVPQYTKINPTPESRWRLSPSTVEAGYESWPGLDELFPVSYQGVNHNRGIDGGIIGYVRSEIEARLSGYFGAKTFAQARELCPEIATERARYDPEKAWTNLKAEGHYKASSVMPFLAFPFDQRWIYYVDKYKWLNEARPEFAENIDDNELFLTVPEPRKESETRPVFATVLPNLHVHERGSVAFPRETRGDDLLSDRDANVGEPTWRVLSEHFGLAGLRRDSDARAFVSRLFRVGFAVLHAPAYQRENKSALSADWAHVPIPKDRTLFDRLVEKGEKVIRLLDTNREADEIVEGILGHNRAAALGPLRRVDGGNLRPGDLNIAVSYWGGSRGRWKPRNYLVEEAPLPSWGERTGDLFINDSTFFANVPEAVWTYQLGGYPVLKKWLGYRQSDRRDNRPLTDDERRWFRHIIQRVGALLALGLDLDALYQEAATDAFTAIELNIAR